MSNKEIAADPVLFADWVNKYLILSFSFEHDRSDVPDDEQCRRLGISEKEKILCANEFVLLRALGACLFVQNNPDERYYVKFKEILLPPVVERMKRHALYLYYDDPLGALEQYLDELKSESFVGFSLAYLNRVYPDCPSGESLFLKGIPVHIGLNYAMITFEAVRNGFSLLTTGLEYNALKELQAIVEKDKNKF